MKKALGAPFRLALQALLVAVVLPGLYLLEPFYRVRFGIMYTQRFGHLSINAETFLRRMKHNGIPARTFYFFFGYYPANRQLFEMWKRLKGFPVRFLESRWGARIMFAWQPILKHTRFWEAHRSTYTEYRLFDNTDPLLSFTPEEEEKGRAGLAEMGIGENDWFVLFHAREIAFHCEWRPHLTDHWEKTSYRNTEILTYMKAAEYIASLGGYALRIGAVVDKPLPDTGNARIIDYSTKHRSDFMDVYLCAKCRFFIGSASGPDVVASAFNVPIVSANDLPYNYTRYNRRSVLVPRIIVKNGGEQPVPYWQAQAAGYYVGWKELSSTHASMHLFDTLRSGEEDILNGVKDMIDILEDREPTPEAKKIQDFYGKLYLSHTPEYTYGGKISARFAMKNRNLIVPPESKP